MFMFAISLVLTSKSFLEIFQIRPLWTAVGSARVETIIAAGYDIIQGTIFRPSLPHFNLQLYHGRRFFKILNSISWQWARAFHISQWS